LTTPNDRTFNPTAIQKLETPGRRLWLPPAKVLLKLGVRPGMRVADIGAGSGYFSIPLASAVAPDGVVKAVDFQPEMLEFLRGKLTGTENIETVAGTAQASTLADSSCDLALLANLWHELDEREAVLAEQRRILCPGGRLAILDWRTDATPPPGPPVAHRIAVADVRAALARAGWLNITHTSVGPYSYLVLADRSAA
jgi:ubiquinone/menaquinone biosynthesis C-methylase UbiE